MAGSLPLGDQDFMEVRETGLLYVDKTGLVVQMLSEHAKVHLFTRPRRFGKSLNLSMLDAFFNICYPRDNRWFDGLEVSRHPECDEHRNAYPVIHFDMNELSSLDFDHFINRLENKLSMLYRQHLYLRDSDKLDDVHKDCFESVLRKDANLAEMEDSLLNLSSMLYAHHGRKVVILIDEYDNAIREAYGRPFHHEVIGTLRRLLSSALKGNRYLMLGVVTGVMQVARESIFSGLNNLTVNNVFSDKFGEMFGFTDDEVRVICTLYGHPERFNEAKEWYDGYRFGSSDVYNPWSILQYVYHDFKPGNYWAGTADDRIILTLFERSDADVRGDVYALSRNEPLIKNLNPAVTFADMDADPEGIYSMMVMSGYLKAVPADNGYVISLPNRELFGAFAVRFASHLRKRMEDSRVELLVGDMARHIMDNNTGALERDLYMLFGSTLASILLRDENSYQMFLTGVLLHMSGKYDVTAEFERGRGRYDILLQARVHGVPHVLIEVKRSKDHGSMDGDARAALDQIWDRDYAFGLEGDVLLYGIAFNGKECRILSDTIHHPSGKQ